MKCSKAKKFISEYIDDDLDAKNTSSLEKHLDTCSKCRDLVKDFQRIKQKAKGLAKAEPSGRTWFRIEARLKEKIQAPIPEPKARFLFFPAPIRYAAGAALTALIIVGGVMIGLKVRDRGGAERGLQGQELALAKIQEAEQHYRLAIKALWEAAQAQKDNLDPKVAETFRINLELIDASLADCERAIKSDPSDLESQYYLLAIYKKKAELLDSMIEVSMTAPQTNESKTIM